MPEAPAPNSASNPSESPVSAQQSGVAGLKKMSLTAGLGSGDYAAVNTLAVVSVMIALLGILAYLGDILLVVPVIAIVCAVVAMRQISASNGTQTGQKAAGAAIIISLIVIAYVGGGRVLTYMHNKPDQEQILATIAEMDKGYAARDYAAVFRLGSPGFQKRVTEKQFVEAMTAFEGVAEFGGIKGVSWNRTPIEFEEDKQSNVKVAFVGARFHFRNMPDGSHIPIGFLKVGDKWMLNDMPSIFKPDNKGQ